MIKNKYLMLERSNLPPKEETLEYRGDSEKNLWVKDALSKMNYCIELEAASTIHLP